MRKELTIFTVFLAMISYSCSIAPGFSETPSIEFLGISKDTLNQGSLLSDSIFLRLSFRDGDGDLGTGAAGITENIILTDSRTKELYDRFRIPPLDLAGAMTGIEGTITLKVFTACCQFPDGSPPCSTPSAFPTNELSLEIQLKDDSGNMSNIVTSLPITLLCN